MVASTKLARVLALWEISPLSAIWWAVRPNKPPRSLLCGVPSLAKTQADISSVLHDFENRYTYGEIVRDQESSFREGEFDGGNETCNEKWFGTFSQVRSLTFKDSWITFLLLTRFKMQHNEFEKKFVIDV